MSRTTRSLIQLTQFHMRALYRNKIAFFFNLVFPLIMVATFRGLYGGTSDVAAEMDPNVPMVESMGRPLSAFDYLMPGQMAVMLLSAGFITVAIGMAGQRQDGSLRHLLSTPLSVGGWTLTRVLGNLVMAVLQGILLFVFGALLFDVAPPANLGGTVVVVIVSTLMSLSMGMLVGVLVKGEGAAMAASMPIYMVLIFLGNSAMPLVDVPPVIERILPWMPTYHMTEAMRAVMMFGESVGTVMKELLILGGIATVFFSLALYMMRRQYVVR